MAKCVWAAWAVGGRADGKRHREQVASGQLRAVKCQAAEVRFMLSVRNNWESDVVGLCALGRLTCGHMVDTEAKWDGNVRSSCGSGLGAWWMGGGS